MTKEPNGTAAKTDGPPEPTKTPEPSRTPEHAGTTEPTRIPEPTGTLLPPEAAVPTMDEPPHTAPELAPTAAQTSLHPQSSILRYEVAGSSLRAPSLETILESGYKAAGASPVHLAVRATASPETTRCGWRGIARTRIQRDQAVRHWFDLDAEDEIPHAEFLEILFTALMDTVQPQSKEILKSNFHAIARGGLSKEYLFLTCFTDYAVHEYILGSGPDSITVAHDQMGEIPSYTLYSRAHAAGDYGDEAILTEAEHATVMDNLLTTGKSEILQRTGTGESVLFLAPLGAHNAIAYEAWLTVDQWNLETQGGVTTAVRTNSSPSDNDHQLTLADLKSRITSAAATDTFANSRIANVSGLNQYYRDIGAYDDITPDDGSDETFMPAMPPPVPTCAGSTAAGTDPDPGLVADCNALLDLKDTLAGTGTLNWSKDLAMTSWDGIRLGGDPQRVHYLLLTDKELDGSIPALLGNLTELRRIDLDENSLTGEIPPQLGMLKKLTHLYLFENQLSGEIPPELGHMKALQVLYLEDNELDGEIPGEIGNLRKLTQLALRDNDLSGAVPERIGDLPELAHLILRDNGFTGQIPRTLSQRGFVNLGLSGNDFTGCLPTRLDSAQSHDLDRPELAALPSCGPAFGETRYSFSLAATSAAGIAVGTVSAAPYETGDAVTYLISAGNEDGLFTVDSVTGTITLAKAATAEDEGSYTLTVEAEDSYGQTATVTVTVTLTG